MSFENTVLSPTRPPPHSQVRVRRSDVVVVTADKPLSAEEEGRIKEKWIEAVGDGGPSLVILPPPLHFVAVVER